MTFWTKTLSTMFALIALGTPVSAAPLTIFAASSMKTALDEIISDSGLDVVASYGGSAAIARQVAQGANADVVILAHDDWMDWLVDQGALDVTTRCDFLGNDLVLAGAADAADLNVQTAEDLINALDGERLAIGHVLSVPAGQYAAAYLQSKGWLDQLRPHFAETTNVRLALALIARGEAPLGFVYASDVQAQANVRAVFVPSPETYPQIRYPIAKTQRAGAGVEDLLGLLRKASATFEAHGFRAVPTGDPKSCEAS